MRATLLAFLLAAAPSAQDASVASGQPSDPGLPRVLVYTLQSGVRHEVLRRESTGELSLAESVLARLGGESGEFEVRVTRSDSEFSPGGLAQYDAVVFFTSGDLPLGIERRAALLSWIREGGAFVGIHSAADTMRSEPEFGRMLGAFTDGSPWHDSVRLHVEDRRHPAALWLGESLTLTDEIPRFEDPSLRERVHVILSLDRTSIDAADGSRPADDQPVAWCREYGSGRVFYSGLGHRAETWGREEFRNHLLGGIRWVLGLREGSAEPSRVSPLPAVAPGWEVELLDRAPNLRWPSAVHCLADGSLLVAEDPMDMIGPADKPIDRIWRYRFEADGSYRRTEFAADLYAVFGLEEIDGAVFVMNMPHLTVLRDLDRDGVAEDRLELLTDLGPPAPGWPGGINDHVVSGIRLGMDGFLYVSVGDKGIPLATGTDGRSITLRGGGIVRLRPDGTELEVVASGTRNHLDVAMNTRGELFTYDNTDDGLGWWTRVTHVVRGGYYGYPWDYLEHPERHLSALTDFGSGAPAGGLAYRGGAWPAEYEDDLFYCEWGKGVLRRIELEPAGGSYRVSGHEDVLEAGAAPDFRPVDVCESPDGRFLYVADWGFPSWRKEDVTGRLWRLRRADDDGPPAALEVPLRGWEAEDLAAPGFRTRLLAQRALSARGPAAVPRLSEVLAGSESAKARRHAIWALDAIDAEAARAALHAALSHPNADTRAQAARALGARRRGDPWALSALLADPDAAVRRAGARSLGRLGEQALDVSLLLALRAELGAGGDPAVRATLRQALVELGAWNTAVAHLAGASDAFAAELVLLLREARDTLAVQALVGLALPEGPGPPTPSTRRADAVALLAELAFVAEPWDGRWWGAQAARTLPPTKTVEWEGTDVALAALRLALDDEVREVRAAALEAALAVRDEAALPNVRARFNAEEDLALAGRVLDVLAALGDAEAVPLLSAVLSDETANDDLFAGAVAAAGRIATSDSVSLLAATAGREDLSPPRVVQCIEAIARAGGQAHVALLEELLGHSGDAVRAAAAEGLGRLGARSALPALMACLDDPAASDAAIRALAQMPSSVALSAYLRGLESEQPGVRGASRLALRELADSVRGEIEALCERGELSRSVLEELRHIYSRPRPILAWTLIGPFGQDDVAPRIEDGILITTGVQRDWIVQRTEPEHGRVNLLPLFDPDQDVTAWARATVRSDAARNAEWSVGSNDGVRVWVNGQFAHEFDGQRAWSPDQSAFEAPLRAGANEVVLELTNAGDDWDFSLKVGEPLGGPLFANDASAGPTLEEYRSAAISGAGYAGRGREVFFDALGPGCFRCHVVEGKGTHIGPELTGIGLRYPREQLARSVLEPSASIQEGYRAEVVELTSGRLLSGLPLREEDGELVLADSTGEELRVRLSDVVGRTPSPLSAMPSGLQVRLTTEQFADLLAFLESLRQAD